MIDVALVPIYDTHVYISSSKYMPCIKHQQFLLYVHHEFVV